jgi:hypothetical protein
VLQVLVRPANLGPCGADWYLDPSETNGNDGDSVIGGQMTEITGGVSFAYSSTTPGNARGRESDTLTSPLGPYLVCGWLDDAQSLVPVATAVASFSLRAPRFTMNVSAPRRARLRHRGTFSVHGTSRSQPT